MGLTKYIIDLGRPVAYFPNLKKVTKSTTASLLLCQLIYWCDKTKDNGWIWKNSNELEEETGLSYNEQRSARKNLVKAKLIEEQEEKLYHRIKFRVDEEKLNELWEQAGGKTTKKSTKQSVKQITQADIKPKSIEEVQARLKPRTEQDIEQKITYTVEPHHSAVEKRDDYVEAILGVNKTPEGERTEKLISMRELFKKKFHINPSGSKWDSFFEFAYIREIKHNEPIETFVKWSLANGFDPRYWTPEKMSTLYPQAFITQQEQTSNDDGFINLMPQLSKDKKYIPMPKEMRNSNDW